MDEEIFKDDETSNVNGKYWVNFGECCAHFACTDAAPNNFAMTPDLTARVSKQLETPEEERQCRVALESCPVAAIRDDGEISLEARCFQAR